MENWKPVVDFENYYEVSNLGNVRGVDRTFVRPNGVTIHWKGRPISKRVSNSGYYFCMLYKNGKSFHVQVHRMVAKSFIKNPLNKPQVNHIDGDKLNNCVSNLEWCTESENMQHAYSNNRIPLNKIGKSGKYNNSARSVVQIDPSTGIEIQRFDTMKEASSVTGCNYSKICECCKGTRKLTNGYAWKYC